MDIIESIFKGIVFFTAMAAVISFIVFIMKDIKFGFGSLDGMDDVQGCALTIFIISFFVIAIVSIFKTF